jgi:Ca-activated chloride channel homolog
MYLTFTHPEYLWYLISIPVLVISHFAFLKYAKRKAIRFANFYALKRVTEQKVITKNYAILIIRACILLLLIIAISGTSLWYKGNTYLNDYVVAIDTSASMSASDFPPSRLDVAKEYTTKFIDAMDAQSTVGLISFSGASFIEQLPTDVKSEVKQSISDIQIAHVGGTNIPDAIVTSTNMLLNSHNGKTIVLITDGSNTESYFTKDPIEQGILYAKKNNVIIYTIGIGTNSGPIGYLPEYYNISAVADSDNLLRIANETGGKYYAATTNSDVSKAYDDILADYKEAYISIDLGIGLSIIALGLLFLEWFLVNTRFKSLP